MNIKFPIALSFAKTTNNLINKIAPDRGSNLSGEKALLIDPEMLAHFNGIDPEKVLFITGTNGKSTTTNLIVHSLKELGYNVISNLEGANLLSGLVTVLSKESDLKGNVDADFYIFEVDERYLPIIYKQLPANNILVTNILKDQVQRNGDPDFIYQKIKEVIKPDTNLFLNAQEPRTKSLEDLSENITYYGVQEGSDSFDNPNGIACPKCSHALFFEYNNIDSIGNFKCSHCDFKSEEIPDYILINKNDKIQINNEVGEIPYTENFMLYNYIAAFSVLNQLTGMSEKEFLKTLENFKNIEGRLETFNFKDKTINYIRIKQENPDTLQNALINIGKDKNKKDVFLGLYPIADFVPGYTNTFYTFDCDLNCLDDNLVNKYYCFSPAVCYDTANRLIYDGIDKDKIIIQETEDPKEIFKQIENSESSVIYLITWLHTYQDLKKYINKTVKND